jgi:uncharacterized protein (TIGR02246 family)
MTKIDSNTSLAEPTAVHAALADRFNQHDLDGLVALYDRDAVLVPQPGTTVTGRDHLRSALAGFLAVKPRQTFVETLGVIVVGDVAFTRSRWGLKGVDPGSGQPLVMEHFGAEVMRRQADGSWRFLIDDPFAADAAKAR